MAQRDTRRRSGRAQTGGRLPESQGLVRAVSVLSALVIVAALLSKVSPL